ncbi:formylglycine-generating enzyme family protein [Geobacter hydrogenophilus]|uniref:Sulfatase-modifying factor enzyme-like domain-containing protein n=1 Tax=Geobacter hydrogenophilus TaxID=40983 RepID=A0A9W6FXU0_9BACT|nr:formylglycine-generating enzyme family protein [Geobacter hydrogenophilus]MBT0895052.1 formylglycine-generating enzyme family protein [Geobacter hydrogenophilus]GLI36876.1 hypothetical protein GHYDROH2_03770 [Geobacter hydrogenophilus]
MFHEFISILMRVLLPLSILIGCAQALNAAEIRNLKPVQVGDRGLASFDLVGRSDEKDSDITVFIEYAGKRYSADKLTISGDVGKNVTIGKGKKIWWDVLKDIPGGIDGDVIWDIEASGGSVIENSGTSRAVFVDPTLGIEFVSVKGGCFKMGNTFGQGDSDEAPAHVVCVDNYALAKYDVTRGDFERFVGETGYLSDAETRKTDKGCYSYAGLKWGMIPEGNWAGPGFYQNQNHPAVCISYNDALTFIKWLSGKSGKSYRLPTEAEWEYAARDGGKFYQFPWGNGEKQGNVGDEALKRELAGWKYDIGVGYDDGWPFTSKVGFYAPNEMGVYDLAGNVSQWVSDWYSEKYYQDSPRDNPTGPNNGEKRVVRGSSWRSVPNDSRTTFRDRMNPNYGANSIGFRLAFPSP